MSEQKHWKLVKLAKDELVTNPVMTPYERARVLATTAEYLYLTYETHLESNDLYVSTDDLTPDMKNKISDGDIYDIDGKPCIALTSNLDIAKVMLNKKVAPLMISREIGRDPKTMTIWVEIWDVNCLQTEPFIPLT